MTGTTARSVVLNGVELNFDRFCLVIDGKDIPLTPTEFRILKFLFSNHDIVFSGTQIMDGINTDPAGNFCGTRAGSMHISTLNRKVGRKLIDSVWGFGYVVRTKEVTP